MARRSGRRKKRSRGGEPPGAGEQPADAGSPAGGNRLERLSAQADDYSDEQGNVLTLRGSLTLGARREYSETLSGARSTAAATPEDAAQRALELLFERLAVRWTISGAPIERQRELLLRFRAATASERAFVRRALREHCERRFPDVQAP